MNFYIKRRRESDYNTDICSILHSTDDMISFPQLHGRQTSRTEGGVRLNVVCPILS